MRSVGSFIVYMDQHVLSGRVANHNGGKMVCFIEMMIYLLLFVRMAPQCGMLMGCDIVTSGSQR